MPKTTAPTKEGKEGAEEGEKPTDAGETPEWILWSTNLKFTGTSRNEWAST